MGHFRVRAVRSDIITLPAVDYPFYRKESMPDGHVNYWRFTNADNAVVLIREGARTTMIQYKDCSEGVTPLSKELLTATEKVEQITVEEFENVRNAIIADLLK